MNTLLQINATELRKALNDIEAAEKNGFMYCEAVFNMETVNRTWVRGQYSDMWEKAHPTSGSLDWGRGQDVSKRNYFRDGKLVLTAEAKKISDNFPESKCVASGTIKGLKYWICPSPMEGLNGYVAFPKRPTVEQGYNGILSYVPVHGGITYASQGKLGMVYGFDTAHHDSEKYPRNDHKWVKKQIGKMVDGILVAKKVEKKYLTTKSQKMKAKYAQMVLDTDKEKENTWNFGMGINMLSGSL